MPALRHGAIGILPAGALGVSLFYHLTGCLSAVRIGATTADRELIQVRCAQAQKPG